MKPFALMLLLVSPALLATTCAEVKVDRPSFEVGESGSMTIENPTPYLMAIGGCNPVFYQQRLPGRWVPDPFIRPACVFSTDPDGGHTLRSPLLIPPHGKVTLGFPTDWLSSTPGIMRVLQRVSVGCRPLDPSTNTVRCRAAEQLVTPPIVIFEPGTTDTVARS